MLEHLTAKDIPGRYKELVDNGFVDKVFFISFAHKLIK